MKADIEDIWQNEIEYLALLKDGVVGPLVKLQGLRLMTLLATERVLPAAASVSVRTHPVMVSQDDRSEGGKIPP